MTIEEIKQQINSHGIREYINIFDDLLDKYLEDSDNNKDALDYFCETIRNELIEVTKELELDKASYETETDWHNKTDLYDDIKDETTRVEILSSALTYIEKKVNANSALLTKKQEN